MNSDVMNTCADMILTDAISDLATREKRSIDDVRAEIIASSAYAALYDFETNLWQEGPDYFIWFYQQSKDSGTA